MTSIRFMIPLFVVVAALWRLSPAFAYEYDAEETTRLMTEMIIDIGGHDAIGMNSGKTLRCANRGTKKITIIQKQGLTSYIGEYGNCQEKGNTRDGLYEIVLRGDEIVSSNSRRSKNGYLFDAAMEGNAGKLRELIKAKADVNYTESTSKIEAGNIDEWTPLMSAVVSGSLENVKQLVKAGAWVNYLNSAIVNAVWIAANKGQLEIVKYLVANGAYINNRNSEDVTPLMVAAMNGHLEIVKFLVASKADLDVVHKEGDSALMFALAQKHTEIARFLIDSEADINIRNKFGVSALMIAVAEGNEEMTGKLLDKNADIGVKTDKGLTPMDIAIAKGYSRIAELIKKAQAPL